MLATRQLPAILLCRGGVFIFGVEEWIVARARIPALTRERRHAVRMNTDKAIEKMRSALKAFDGSIVELDSAARRDEQGRWIVKTPSERPRPGAAESEAGPAGSV